MPEDRPPPSSEPTLPESPPSRSATLDGTRGSATRWGTTEVPLILRNEEALRSRAFVRIVAVLSIVAMIGLWIPRDGVPGRVPCVAAYGVTLIVSLFLMWRLRDLKKFSHALALVHGLLCALSILATTVYVGVFSPTIMGVCVGIYYFGLSDAEHSAAVIFAVSAIGYLALVVFAAFGAIDVKTAVIAVEHPDWPGLVTVAAILEALLALTLWMARRSRLATLDAFERLDKAARQIRQRDALLNEARLEMDVARAANLGRYSGDDIGDYAVHEVLGRGAMGEVYRAEDKATGESAAIKVLHPMVLSEPHVVERFQREAKMAGSIDSPHVVRVLGAGNTRDGVPYIAMELLVGQDLSEKLRGARKLGTAEVVDLVSQVALALSTADEAGIVHRDVKPQNLFLVDRDGKQTWKVLDFGVSKLRETQATLTQGQVIGTPSYMAPEQALGLPVDHRADVFSLGVIAYRALTGRPAFTGPDSVTTIYNVLHFQPARPSELVTLDRDVDRVLALALAKEKERRFGSANMFAAALRDAVKKRLDDRLRHDAERLLAEQPWGKEIREKKKGRSEPPRIVSIRPAYDPSIRPMLSMRPTARPPGSGPANESK
jgi:serine/threonine-protein kinase